MQGGRERHGAPPPLKGGRGVAAQRGVPHTRARARAYTHTDTHIHTHTHSLSLTHTRPRAATATQRHPTTTTAAAAAVPVFFGLLITRPPTAPSEGLGYNRQRGGEETR